MWDVTLCHRPRRFLRAQLDTENGGLRGPAERWEPLTQRRGVTYVAVQNIGSHSSGDTASHPGRLES